MLHRVAQCELQQEPRKVEVLHHMKEHIVIATVIYATNEDARRRGQPATFTVVELNTPNYDAAPLRVLEVPVAGVANVYAAVPQLSADLAEVVVVVHGEAFDGSSISYLFHREVVQPSDDEEEEEDEDAEEESSTKAGTSVGDGCAAGHPRRGQLQYRRLPRPIEEMRDDDVSSVRWSAAVALDVQHIGSPVASDGAVVPPSTYIVAAGSCTSTTDEQNNNNNNNNNNNSGRGLAAVQVVELRGLRGRVVRQLVLPAVSGFDVTAMAALPGRGDAVLLLCHHAVVEVNLAMSGNAAVRRAWRWSPHDRLTALTVRDHQLMVGTEGGAVVVWDLRRAADEAAAQVVVSLGKSSPHVVSGMHAPYSTDLLTCSLTGPLLTWSYDPSGALPSHTPRGNDVSEHYHCQAVMFRANGEAVLMKEPSTAIITPGSDGLRGMAGCGNIVAAVSELGRLQLLVCA